MTGSAKSGRAFSSQTAPESPTAARDRERQTLAAAPKISVMKSRRLMTPPMLKTAFSELI
jgi:hypothetical protein